MINLAKLALSLLAIPAIVLAASQASADVPASCGAFAGIIDGTSKCEVRVKASCSVDCSSLSFTAGCQGGCSAPPDPACVQTQCGAGCIAQCDPSKLDCVQGCHDECEQPAIDDCKVKHPERDCVSDAVASCNGYCRDACKVPPTDCIEHCDRCCTGACISLSNLECNISCYAKLSGTCTAQCDAPSGALFCDGQYVGAGDVDTCISDLAKLGVNINVEARGEITCDLTGCHSAGSASVGGIGCSASAPGPDSPFAAGALALGLVGAGISVARRRNRKAR